MTIQTDFTPTFHAGFLTYLSAARILEDHKAQYRPSSALGKIECLAIYTRNGKMFEEWECVDMTIPALREWLNY